MQTLSCGVLLCKTGESSDLSNLGSELKYKIRRGEEILSASLSLPVHPGYTREGCNTQR